MVDVRWPLVVLVLVALLAIPVYGANSWGCCVPKYLPCYSADDGGFSSKASFVSACNADDGSIQGEDVFTTCYGVTECTMGCCCAGDDVTDSGIINSQEEVLRTTSNACTNKNEEIQGTFTFSPGLNESNSTYCRQVCGGYIGPPGSDVNYTVSGTVSEATTGPLSGVEVFIPVPNGMISDISDSAGDYSLEDVPEISAHVFAIYPNCLPGQSGLLYVNQDLTGVDVTIDCTSGGCTHENPTVVDVSSVVGQSAISITVSVTDSCQDFVQYEPSRCDSNFQNCIALPFSPTPAIVDSQGIQDTTTYCYKVNARFGDGTVTSSGESSTACITTGSPECTNVPPGVTEWCGTVGTPPQSAIVTCDVNNVLQSVETCTNNTVCSEISGTPTCIAAPQCDQCNGLLGLFSKLGLLIPVGPLIQQCGEETPLCYIDSEDEGNPLLIDAYQSCLGVADCTNYASSTACNENPCTLQDTCSWQDTNIELGQGVCLGSGTPDCSACDDLFGYCSKDLCTAISPECYYDELENGLSETQGCIHKDDMACRYYDTEADCTNGGPDAAFAITYDSNGDRDGIDNVRTQDSDDLMNISTCTWVAAKSRCIKDADMKTTNDEDDCIESGLAAVRGNADCTRDSTPPVTTFFLIDPPVYGINSLRSLPYSVVDDKTPVDKIRTYVCFATRGGSCYPTEELATFALPTEGSYDMYYYSIDEGENSEVLQYVEIEVANYGIAALSYIDIVPGQD